MTWVPSEATWRSGDVADCKSAHPGSIPGVASNTTSLQVTACGVRLDTGRDSRSSRCKPPGLAKSRADGPQSLPISAGSIAIGPKLIHEHHSNSGFVFFIFLDKCVNSVMPN
jgi:hypothetical protein